MYMRLWGQSYTPSLPHCTQDVWPNANTRNDTRFEPNSNRDFTNASNTPSSISSITPARRRLLLSSSPGSTLAISTRATRASSGYDNGDGDGNFLLERWLTVSRMTLASPPPRLSSGSARCPVPCYNSGSALRVVVARHIDTTPIPPLRQLKNSRLRSSSARVSGSASSPVALELKTPPKSASPPRVRAQLSLLLGSALTSPSNSGDSDEL